MKFESDYYFEEIEENEIFSKLIDKDQNVMEIFTKASEIIEEIKKQDKQNINTDKIQENVKIMGNVYIGEGTEIESGVIIQGPVYIGKSCKIMYNSYIRPGTIMGDNCVIGFSTEVKHTVMRYGSKI